MLKERFKTRIATNLTGYVLGLMVAVLLTLVIMVVSVVNIIDQRIYTHKGYNMDTILKDYIDEGMDVALRNTNGLVEYIEFLNEDKRVKDEAGSPHAFGYQYSQKEYDDLFKNYTEFITYHPFKDKEDLFVVYGPDLIAPPFIIDIIIYHFIVFIAVTAVLMMLLMYHLKFHFVHPILLMKEAVERISAGNYVSEVPFSSENELEVLKKSIIDMGQTINKQVNQLQEAETERKRMVLSMSHDIRTPLTNIAGYAETLINEHSLSPQMKKNAVNVIHSNAMLANNLVNDLFDFAKYDSEQLVVENRSHDVAGVLRNTLIQYYPDIEGSQKQIEVLLPDDECHAVFDVSLFKRLISNLISNAIRYSSDGGTITVELTELDETVEIMVQDEGPGIPDSIKSDLFKPFVIGDEARSKGAGTGLGLTIVKRLVDRLCGTLTWDETYTSGVRWLISLNKEPIKQESF